MNIKTVGCMILALGAVAFSASAADYYLKSGVTDWAVADSYTTDAAGTQTATSVPSGSDTIVLPANATFELTAPSGSFDVFANCKRITPQDGSVVEVTVAEGEATMNSAFRGTGDCGELVKLGDGMLTLASTDAVVDGQFMRGYQTAITVSSGSLKLPQAVTSTYNVFGRVTVAAGATLYTCCEKPGSEAGAWTNVKSLFGAGLVTNAPPAGCTRAQYNLDFWDAKTVSKFSGKICKPIVIYNADGGPAELTGAESDFATLYLCNASDNYPIDVRGMISVPSLAYPGPLGGWGIQFRDKGGIIHYFGEGETTTRSYDFYQQNTDGMLSYFDAGWKGGITFTGSWRVWSENAVRPIVLTGSNTTACVFNNSFEDKSKAQNSAIYPIKRGTGTWRFGTTAQQWRDALGGMAVEDGVLEFETIAEKGANGSLGKANRLTACDAAALKDGKTVPYAYTLGSAAGGRGMMSYVGTNNAVCTTRPAVLAGEGGFRNSSGKLFCFAGVSGRDAGKEMTFVVDGTNTATNRIADVTDGEGTVSVVKEGTGTWKLTGEQSFSGDLKVKAGTLLVEGKDEKYTWFRWTIKELQESGYQLALRQFALLDKDCYQQNVGLTYTVATPPSQYWDNAAVNSDYLPLNPGEVAFGRAYTAGYGSGYGPAQLFIGNVSGLPLTMQFGGSGNLSKDVPGSWIVFVMRLPVGANEVVAHDVMGYNPSSYLLRWPKRAMVEASIDGVKWDVVWAEQDYEISENARTKNNFWYKSGNWLYYPNKIGTEGFRHTAGHVTRSPLKNVRSVSVAKGATLKADGSLTIKGLTIDASGMGTIDGFAFAENGTLAVENAEPGKAISVTGDYRNVTSLGNLANWSVRVNGVDRKNYSVAVDEATGTVSVQQPGMVILVR